METPQEKLNRLKKARSYLRTTNIQFVKLYAGPFEHIQVCDDILPTKQIKAMYDQMLTLAIERQENMILKKELEQLKQVSN